MFFLNGGKNSHKYYYLYLRRFLKGFIDREKAVYRHCANKVWECVLRNACLFDVLTSQTFRIFEGMHTLSPDVQSSDFEDFFT